MANAVLKKKVRKVLQNGYFKDPDDHIVISDGPEDSIHVVVISDKLHGRRMKEKNDLILSDLISNLRKEEWSKITLSLGQTHEELKAN